MELLLEFTDLLITSSAHQGDWYVSVTPVVVINANFSSTSRLHVEATFAK